MPAATKTKLDPATILKDSKNFADDIEITLPNGAIMTLGDLREYDTATQGSVQKELERGRKELDADRKKVEAASNSVASLYVELEKQKGELEARSAALGKGTGNRTAVDPLDEVLESDPVYARLSKTISALESKFEAATKKMDEGFANVSSTMNQVGSTYLSERYQRDFNDLMAKDDPVRPKDLDIQGLYKYATDNGFKNKNGIYDLNRAYDSMTQAARTKHLEQSAYERGKEDASKEAARNNMMPRPTNGPAIPGLDNIIKGAAAPKSLDEAFAAAANDPLIWNAGQQPS